LNNGLRIKNSAANKRYIPVGGEVQLESLAIFIKLVKADSDAVPKRRPQHTAAVVWHCIKNKNVE
jgi:hypothetical protein